MDKKQKWNREVNSTWKQQGNCSPKCSQDSIEQKMRTTSTAPRSRKGAMTMSSRNKSKTRQILIRLQESYDVDRWSAVRSQIGIAKDIDVVRFLIGWYLDRRGMDESLCVWCHSPLTMFCRKCQLSAASGETGGRIEEVDIHYEKNLSALKKGTASTNMHAVTTAVTSLGDTDSDNHHDSDCCVVSNDDNESSVVMYKAGDADNDPVNENIDDESQIESEKQVYDRDKDAMKDTDDEKVDNGQRNSLTSTCSSISVSLTVTHKSEVGTVQQQTVLPNSAAGPWTSGAGSKTNSDRPFACTYSQCGLAFRMKKTLDDHLTYHLTHKVPTVKKSENGRLDGEGCVEVVKPITVCEQCGKGFDNRRLLNQHRTKKHMGIFECLECHSHFTSKHSLRVHEDWRHKGLKKYGCDLCPKRFVSHYGLTLHLRSHRNERPFMCSHCDSSFIRKVALQKHMMRHTGQKPHRCVDCGQEYKCLTSFATHRKKYHSDSVYICKMCGMFFHIPSSFCFHMRKFHQELVDEKSMPEPMSRVDWLGGLQVEQQYVLQQQHTETRGAAVASATTDAVHETRVLFNL